MRNIIRLEETAMLGLAIYMLSLFQPPWWVYLLLILGPDISMIAYAINNTFGAVSYNLFHHKGIAVAVFITGFILENQWLQIAGLILFGHSSMDRMFGYGLKTTESFKHTHLGTIGKSNQ